MYYYGARYYSAWLGRFVSVDPLQFKFPNISPFSYGNNNPIKYIDPDGKAPKNPDWWINDKTNEVKEYENKKLWNQPEMKEKGFSYLGEYRTDLGGALDKPIYFSTVELFNRDQALWIAGYEIGRGEVEGEEGLKRMSTGITTLGIGMLATPLAPAGEVLIVGSMMIDSGLDFKNESAKTASMKTGIRLAFYFGGSALTKEINLFRSKHMIKALPELGDRLTSFAINAEANAMQNAILDNIPKSDNTYIENNVYIDPSIFNSNSTNDSVNNRRFLDINEIE